MSQLKQALDNFISNPLDVGVVQATADAVVKAIKSRNILDKTINQKQSVLPEGNTGMPLAATTDSALTYLIGRLSSQDLDAHLPALIQAIQKKDASVAETFKAGEHVERKYAYDKRTGFFLIKETREVSNPAAFANKLGKKPAVLTGNAAVTEGKSQFKQVFTYDGINKASEALYKLGELSAAPGSYVSNDEQKVFKEICAQSTDQQPLLFEAVESHVPAAVAVPKPIRFMTTDQINNKIAEIEARIQNMKVPYEKGSNLATAYRFLELVLILNDMHQNTSDGFRQELTNRINGKDDSVKNLSALLDSLDAKYLAIDYVRNNGDKCKSISDKLTSSSFAFSKELQTLLLDVYFACINKGFPSGNLTGHDHLRLHGDVLTFIANCPDYRAKMIADKVQEHSSPGSLYNNLFNLLKLDGKFWGATLYPYHDNPETYMDLLDVLSGVPCLYDLPTITKRAQAMSEAMDALVALSEEYRVAKDTTVSYNFNPLQGRASKQTIEDMKIQLLQILKKAHEKSDDMMLRDLCRWIKNGDQNWDATPGFPNHQSVYANTRLVSLLCHQQHAFRGMFITANSYKLVSLIAEGTRGIDALNKNLGIRQTKVGNRR